MQTLHITIITRERIFAGSDDVLLRSRGVHWCLFDNKGLCA